MSSSGSRSSKAATVGSMIRSNIGPLEVESADHRSDSRLAREVSCVCHHVDDAGMTTACEDDKAAIGQPHHERLVVEDQPDLGPSSADVRLVSVEAGLELRCAIDLAGYQHRSVEEKRRLAFLDDLEAGTL